MDKPPLIEEVSRKAARKLRSRRESKSVWFGFGLFGLVGWSVMVPTLMGIGLGVWIDQQAYSQYSWTLMLMILGVSLGCLNAWYWIQRESNPD